MAETTEDLVAQRHIAASSAHDMLRRSCLGFGEALGGVLETSGYMLPLG